MVVSYGSSATVTFEEAVTGYISDVGRTISLDGVIYINQYSKYNDFDLTSDYISVNGGLLVWYSAVEETNATHESTVEFDDNVGLIYTSSNQRYMGRTDGIAAKEYADEVFIRMYVKLENGNYVYGDLIEYSVQDYAEHKIANASTYGTKLVNLCVAMLHYGAAAQTQLKYNTSDLANANIAEEYPAFDFSVDYINLPADAETDIVQSSSVTTYGQTISLDGAIVANFYYKTSIEVASAKLLFWENVEETLTLDNYTSSTELTYITSYSGSYFAQSREFSAKEYDAEIYVCAVFTDADGNTYTSNVIGYNPEVYANKWYSSTAYPALADLVQLMVTYGQYAKVYFGLA